MPSLIQSLLLAHRLCIHVCYLTTGAVACASPKEGPSPTQSGCWRWG